MSGKFYWAIELETTSRFDQVCARASRLWSRAASPCAPSANELRRWRLHRQRPQRAADLSGAGDRQSTDLARAVGSARDIKNARDRFGEFADRLVPQFMERNFPGVYGFFCPMTKRPRAQRGEKKGNPYYGAAMADCGNPLESK